MNEKKTIIAAIICTHNPRAAYLNRVLAALEAQTLPREQWELLIVDSASMPPVALRRDLQIPSSAKIVRVERPGLALARRTGAEATRATLLASVDDDTVFSPGYLATAVAFMDAHPKVASCGGKFLPEFEVPPPAWFRGFEAMIAIRDLGPEEIIVPGWINGRKPAEFPDAVPIGVNVSQRAAYEQYLQRWAGEAGHASLGRSGQSLASGEDNDFSLCCLEAGWSMAYVPGLLSLHLIPASRFDLDYLGRLNRASCRTWVQVLAMHGIGAGTPIPAWTLPLRRLKAWFALRAWAGPAEWIRWQGASGQFEGLAALPRH